MVDFLFALFELFRYLLLFRSYKAKCVQLGGFVEVDLYALKFYLDRVPGSSFSNHCWHQKTSDTGLPHGEDHIPLRSLGLTQCRSVTDRRTEGQTDGFVVAYTALAKLAARCINVRILQSSVDLESPLSISPLSPCCLA